MQRPDFGPKTNCKAEDKKISSKYKNNLKVLVG